MRAVADDAPMTIAALPRPVAPGPDGFAQRLRTWRVKRRLSQLELALESGVSQRHVSFLESGRARPSRAMVLQLSETLDVPLRERNDWLIAAGFAPIFRARTLDDPEMAHVRAALRLMLTNHEPFPAVAVDRAWNVREANRPFELLAAALGEETWANVGGSGRNLMRLIFHPAGIRRSITNWETVAPLLWHRACREAEAVGGQEMQELLEELARYQDPATLWPAVDAALVPVLPIELDHAGLRVSFFSVISTFGTAQDVTADELRIESFFPADAATEELFRNLARGQGAPSAP